MLSRYFICQTIIDIFFVLFNVVYWIGVFYPQEKTTTSGNVSVTTKPTFWSWLIFLVIVLWILGAVVGIIFHIIARIKFKQGGDKLMSQIAVIASLVANGSGATIYGAIVGICFFIGFGISSSTGTFGDIAGSLFIFLGLLFVPVLLIFVSQLTQGCKALNACKMLRGSKGNSRNMHANQYRQNANQSMN